MFLTIFNKYSQYTCVFIFKVLTNIFNLESFFPGFCFLYIVVMTKNKLNYNSIYFINQPSFNTYKNITCAVSFPSIMQHNLFYMTKNLHSTHKEHQINTRYTRPAEWHTHRSKGTLQYEDRKRTDIPKTPKLRTMIMYINEYYWKKWAECSRFHQIVLPKDGPMRPKHVARQEHFNWHFSELSVSLVSYKIKGVLHYRQKRNCTSDTLTLCQP
jgi:hypothetical protein